MNPETIRQETEGIAREAGKILLEHLGRVGGIEHKGAVDLVTEADRASEAFLVLALGKLLPEASILAEEGSGVDRGSRWRWIVDPLDGTTNFTHAYPVFCVAIALDRDGETQLGVVMDPTRGECFSAQRGEGARCNGETLSTSTSGDLGRALVVTGFPYDVRNTARNNLPQFEAFIKRARGVRRDGSAALNLAYVAAGRFDGFWEEGLSPWDVAAGALLVSEAGGTVTGYAGDRFDHHAGNVVASNSRIHQPMIEVLQEIESTGGLPDLSQRRITP